MTRQERFQEKLTENREFLAEFTKRELVEEAQSLRLYYYSGMNKQGLTESIACKWAYQDIPAPIMQGMGG